jgi:molybdate transport system substrate-binding protein
MKKYFQTLAIAGVILFTLNARAAEITVFAAVSLTDSLKEIAVHYEKQTGENVVFNFGASSTMARQIEEGAPADIFFSADEAKMDGLQKRGFILSGTRKDRLSNSLVIVVPSDSSLAITSATNLVDAVVRRIALADPKAVPAGIYSKEYLEKLHLWKTVQPKVVPTENVRAALAAVESGNVEAGMVYKTDAAISHKVKVAYEISLRDGPKITYPVAVIQESKHIAEAMAFVKYLESDDAAQVFEKYGFIVRK